MRHVLHAYNINKIRFMKRVASRNFFVSFRVPQNQVRFPINQKMLVFYLTVDFLVYEYLKIKLENLCVINILLNCISLNKFDLKHRITKLPGHFLVILSKGKCMSSVSRLFKDGRL